METIWSTDWPTDRPTLAKQYTPSSSKGGIKIHSLQITIPTSIQPLFRFGKKQTNCFTILTIVTFRLKLINAVSSFPAKISNIRQYRNKSVIISGLLFFHNLGHLIICILSFFTAMYLLPLKTELGFHNRYKKMLGK